MGWKGNYWRLGRGFSRDILTGLKTEDSKRGCSCSHPVGFLLQCGDQNLPPREPLASAMGVAAS